MVQSYTGIPKRVKEGMVYFGVRIEQQEKAGGKRSSGVGYSNGGKESHDFSVHDQKFKEQMDGLKKFLEMSDQVDSIKLARVGHIDFAAWLLQFLEEVSGGWMMIGLTGHGNLWTMLVVTHHQR